MTNNRMISGENRRSIRISRGMIASAPELPPDRDIMRRRCQTRNIGKAPDLQSPIARMAASRRKHPHSGTAPP